MSSQLTTNFLLTEFACKDGTQVPEQYLSNIVVLADNLQALRDFVKEPVIMNSAYRTPSYNKKVGGKMRSKHMLGQAADINVKSKTPKELHAIIEALIEHKIMKQGGLGLYPGFVHYDVRGIKARW